MLSDEDATNDIDEPRTARMEQRPKPHVKTVIQTAAALLGVDEASFATSSAYERARLTIADHERTVLSDEDLTVFFAAMENPTEPTPALREAVAIHRRPICDAE